MKPEGGGALGSFARQLRRELTPEERHLWYDFLKDYPAQFRRQKVCGPYILDFYCAQAALAVELDGSQHYLEPGRRQDEVRTAFLQRQGLEVLRFSNLDVRQNFTAVCEAIDQAVRRRGGRGYGG